MEVLLKMQLTASSGTFIRVNREAPRRFNEYGAGTHLQKRGCMEVPS